MQWWQWSPYTSLYVYWRQKEAFELKVDTYRDWTLFAVMEGRFRYRMGEMKGEAAFGDLVFCPPGMAFEREVMEPLSFHFYKFRWRALHPAERAAAEIEGSPTGSSASGPTGLIGNIGVKDHQRLNSTYLYLQQASILAGEKGKERADHFLRDLWTLVCMESEQKLAAFAGAAADPEMKEAASWLQQHAYGPVLIKEYGAARGWSPVQFTRRFQAAYGQTPMDYLTSLRLQKAQALLLSTNLTLDQIAEQCGYENGFYLSRMFTRKLIVSPSVYRKLHRL